MKRVCYCSQIKKDGNKYRLVLNNIDRVLTAMTICRYFCFPVFVMQAAN
ncbi:hypothetical protein DDI_2925 [Dickeya dianthicola RNS04.9]|nr:hypothetical protein DDI_2925 [Dickeya dianthicola RNS04.9]